MSSIKATADYRVPFSFSDLEDIVVCARSVHRVPLCFDRRMGSEAMNDKTQDDVYGGRLINAKKHQSEFRNKNANARALERGVVAVGVERVAVHIARGGCPAE